MFRRFFGMPMMPSPERAEAHLAGFGLHHLQRRLHPDQQPCGGRRRQVTVRLQDRRTLDRQGGRHRPALRHRPAQGGARRQSADGDASAIRAALKPGQWVLAIGSPFGFDYTVTQGIVSAVGRNLGEQDQPYTSFIQTDVPINRGNSGGPLFNLQGQVVGVNSQIYSNTGGYQGVSFSIPIDVAMNVVEQIKEQGLCLARHARRAGQAGHRRYGQSLKSAIAATVRPWPRSPRAAAPTRPACRPGDVILSYNGQTHHAERGSAAAGRQTPSRAARLTVRDPARRQEAGS